MLSSKGCLSPSLCHQLPASRQTSSRSRVTSVCRAQLQEQGQRSCNSRGGPEFSRRTQLLGLNVGVLAALVDLSGERPTDLGVKDYGSLKSLGLCSSKTSCISTSEEANLESKSYVAPWSYNPIPGRGRKKPVPQSQGMQELVDTVTSTSPDNYSATVIQQSDDYLYVEYKSAFLGKVDDVEFWFPQDKAKDGIVEYRSASRQGKDGGKSDSNRKRIKELRKELQKKGWASTALG
ncbi:hypothetical protein WJX74_005330 [Apatococcus lobatus]|uniref:Uncharacterized protein n=1 Tax=Apatococcus lobatus TaxID=904363 RepID=A0AAW1REI9_9CHLO